MPNAKPKTLILSLFVLALAASVLGGFAGGFAEGYLVKPQSSTVSTPNTIPTTPVDSTKSGLEALIKQVTPSVVNITDTTESTGRFGQAQSAQTAGTGMIITADGYILTNKHVVSSGSSSISVQTSDNKQYSARAIATSSNNDLALLKIEATNLTTIHLGDSDGVVLGQSVIAIGNTLGEFQNTVTQGIISGLNRTISAADTIYNQQTLSGLIQTDAAINPGNSGGPLVGQATGTTIGINTATSTNAQNIGFVIPINQAKDFIKSYVTIQ